MIKPYESPQAGQPKPTMLPFLKKAGIMLVGLMIFACLCPFYTIVLIPIGPLLGSGNALVVVAYCLSGATAIYVVTKMWPRKAPKPPTEM